jgi:hypothetical protein
MIRALNDLIYRAGLAGEPANASASMDKDISFPTTSINSINLNLARVYHTTNVSDVQVNVDVNLEFLFIIKAYFMLEYTL